MIQLQGLIGSVITIRSVWGNEYVGTLLGYSQHENTITVSAPQTVATENDTVMLVPFTVTGQDSEAVTINLSTVFTVVATKTDVADSYMKIIMDK